MCSLAIPGVGIYGPTYGELVITVCQVLDRRLDGTATWSLVTVQRALRRAPDGLARVSTHTIGCVLHEAGYTWQRDRSWCDTGKAIRVRKSGQVARDRSRCCGKKI
jgi:hypothetical protein